MFADAARPSWGLVDGGGLEAEAIWRFKCIIGSVLLVKCILESLEGSVEKPGARVAWQYHEKPSGKLLK